jgi:hypothetical protein
VYNSRKRGSSSKMEKNRFRAYLRQLSAITNSCSYVCGRLQLSIYLYAAHEYTMLYIEVLNKIDLYIRNLSERNLISLSRKI